LVEARSGRYLRARTPPTILACRVEGLHCPQQFGANRRWHVVDGHWHPVCRRRLFLACTVMTPLALYLPP